MCCLLESEFEYRDDDHCSINVLHVISNTAGMFDLKNPGSYIAGGTNQFG